MQTVPNIMVVDDDAEIRSLLGRYLREQGFRVCVAANRREFDALFAERNPDLLVLDVLLPDGSGLDICRVMRSQRQQVPIILLTALKEDVDRIIGLEIGADDYMSKPFNPRELTARIKAVLRRSNGEKSTTEEISTFEFADFVVEPRLRKVAGRSGSAIDLTGAEFDLLKVFLERPGKLLSRDQLLDLTQGRDRDPLDRSIDVLMSRLRKKLGDSEDRPLFKTIRNGGYQLTVPVTVIVTEA
ncbi:response regulator [Phyllobacterium myrsinacearum]|uniref:Two-component system OmpR family response regulator n=1 Tax=Phyllobacterium myrsinacearum TaxID=28101 RepID=A0A839EMN6_9HYPH|nr:response regulator [Phyllobacterium myrsinacearum]MBA8880102.1 two-component system OmpR family response regulator [Phyllobacterium myrsinacearum]